MAIYFTDESGFLTKIPPVTQVESLAASPGPGEYNISRNIPYSHKKRKGHHAVARKSQPQGEVKPVTASDESGTAMVLCPYCKVPVRASRVDTHVANRCPQARRTISAEVDLASHSNEDMLKCPRCSSLVASSRMDDHLANECMKTRLLANPATTPQPFWGARVSVPPRTGSRSANSCRHLNQLELPLGNSAEGPSHDRTPSYEPARTVGELNTPNLRLEALDQSFDERRDGGKLFAHMEREWDGKFGSLPLFDDYDDESGPE